jgi:hypothetical protein
MSGIGFDKANGGQSCLYLYFVIFPDCRPGKNVRVRIFPALAFSTLAIALSACRYCFCKESMFRIGNSCPQVVGQLAKRRPQLVNGGIPEFANRINWYFENAPWRWTNSLSK